MRWVTSVDMNAAHEAGSATCSRELADMSRGSMGAAFGTARAEDSEGAEAGPSTGATGSDDDFTDAAAGVGEDDADAESAGGGNCDDNGFASET
jgi:hypothetical protein